MRAKTAKKIRKALQNPGADILVMIHKVYGERTKDMNQRQLYQATKKLVERGLIKVN